MRALHPRRAMQPKRAIKQVQQQPVFVAAPCLAEDYERIYGKLHFPQRSVPADSVPTAASGLLCGWSGCTSGQAGVHKCW